MSRNEPKYPRRADNTGLYPLRWEIQRVIQHAKKILKELDARLLDERKRYDEEPTDE